LAKSTHYEAPTDVALDRFCWRGRQCRVEDCQFHVEKTDIYSCNTKDESCGMTCNDYNLKVKIYFYKFKGIILKYFEYKSGFKLRPEIDTGVEKIVLINLVKGFLTKPLNE
jgi:hypothetical protein